MRARVAIIPAATRVERVGRRGLALTEPLVAIAMIPSAALPRTHGNRCPRGKETGSLPMKA